MFDESTAFDADDAGLLALFAVGALIGQMAAFRPDERIDAPALAKDCFTVAAAMVEELRRRKAAP